MSPALKPDHGTTALKPCPFCGSTNIDPAGWATLPEYAKTSDERSGPACDDCGASANTAEIWNKRPEAERLRQGIADFIAGQYANGVLHYQKCPHGRFGYEDCEGCAVDHFLEVLGTPAPEPPK